MCHRWIVAKPGEVDSRLGDTTSFSTSAKTPWASGSAPISRYSGGFPRIPAEGVVTDVTDVVFHIFCPCGAGKKHDPSRPEPGQDT